MDMSQNNIVADAGYHAPTESLSPREMEILLLLSRALSTKSVARTLVVSPGTVKWHLQNIYGKLRAHSRESAVMRARSIGLIQ